MDLGSKIRELRKEKIMSQEDLADYLHLSASTISNYEKNRHSPGINDLCKMADLFGVSTDYLMGRTSFRYSFNVLKRRINDKGTLGTLLNKLVTLEVQYQEEILDFTEFRLQRSMEQKNFHKKRAED